LASKKGTRTPPGAYNPVETFKDVLDQSGIRPDPLAEREPKKAYAERLSNKIAILIANRLRRTESFEGEILPRPDGRGRESPVPSGAFNKAKKTDVNFSTLSGLELLVSIKTLSFRDTKRIPNSYERVVGRYTKNMVRNDHELRAEAMEFHERYPFAVLVALMFMPLDCCSDAGVSYGDKSSFAHAIMTFRGRGGRKRPDESAQMFELFYIALYEWEGEKAGNIRFFDVMDAPPKRGIPKALVDLDTVINRIVATYGLRNRKYIPWEDEDLTTGTLRLGPASEEEDGAEGGGRTGG
jgi:hypothetical protein